ncbi:MAG: dihydrofolate reductase [Cycloclasticus pugetii]|jgi:dihydrofolate reductase|uniref:dihydrofolate reductase n=1 Tax=Cycloclasticus pugetii TaxID=34068 RepID=UPI00091C4648|nr:dihydrofolate reductase [Cycloclasticus pugetii]MDF1828944.1 dihydrofolate reductase [Cycloclasticus pugetii]SHI62885.1 dihydrofolate reductase [Cycloclasticus pugetii]
MISMIVAMAENRAIGKNNELLWHLPKDFQHFKSVTMGKPILMGRKTFESIGKALPGRKNIVITRDNNFTAEGIVIVHSITAALEATEEFDDVMVIGGASFYEQMLPVTETLYLTVVHQDFEADAFFPEIKTEEWEVVEQVKHEADEKHAYPYSFITYRRI